MLASLVTAAAAAWVIASGGRLDHTLEPADMPDGAPAGAIAARVDRVVDGDTIDLMIDGTVQRVRLIGIDTPETVKPDTAVDCYGPEASAETARLLPIGSAVALELDDSQGDTDRYGRTLGYVWSTTDAKPSLVNLQLLETGHAREYTYDRDTPYAYQAAFQDAADAAAAAGAGLWSACE